MSNSSKSYRLLFVLLSIFLFSPPPRLASGDAGAGRPAEAKYGGGSGEPNDSYQIATADDLILLGDSPEDYDKHFILTADIDLDPNLPGRKVFDKAVIAPDTIPSEWYFQGTSFTGVLDGNGHTISHLTIQGETYVGLFGQLASGAEAIDLGIVDCNVTGPGDCVGALVGDGRGAVTHCYSTGAVSGKGNVGGLVGYNYYGRVIQCYSSGTVSGGSNIGGLVGLNLGHVNACYSTGAVSGSRLYVGGLVGDNFGGVVALCYSTGAVSGDGWVGGLVGWNRGESIVSNSYSTGAVSSDSYVGGLVGENSGTITDCFWDVETSGLTASPGGMGKMTSEMQMTSTFIDADWDFVDETANGTEDIWWILEGKDYPRLWWEPNEPQTPEGPAGMVFVDIPAGTFEMGDHDGTGRLYDRPVHTVTLDGFRMSRCETTNAQYAAYLNGAMAGGLIQVVSGVVYASVDTALTQPYCDTYSSSSYSQIEYNQGQFTVLTQEGKGMSDYPVVMVSWYGAKAFCEYYQCRLPTEAQWEYAARGGYHDPYYQYPWGSNSIDCSKANYHSSNGYCNPLNLSIRPWTSPVAYYGSQGAYGLCDMSGNVWEWCQDWFSSDYYSWSPTSEPTGPTAGTHRVLRGGSWNSDSNNCRVDYRYWYYPYTRSYYYGFRVCR